MLTAVGWVVVVFCGSTISCKQTLDALRIRLAGSGSFRLMLISILLTSSVGDVGAVQPTCYITLLFISASNFQSIFASNGRSVLLYMTGQCSRILVVSPSLQFSAIFVSLCFCDLSLIWKTYSLVIILSNQPGNCEYWKISPSVSSPPPSPLNCKQNMKMLNCLSVI